MGITVEKFLETVEADDYFHVVVRKGRDRLFFGYSDQVPEELKKKIIRTVYVDWADEAMGIEIE